MRSFRCKCQFPLKQLVLSAGSDKGTSTDKDASSKPAKESISSIENTSTDSITVKWAKNANASGYEIQYATQFKVQVRAYKKVNTLTIGTNVENIASEAFLNCSKLIKITIKTQKLKDKKIGAKAFKGLDKKATIKVPKSKLSAYTKLIKEAGFSEKTQKITK